MLAQFSYIIHIIYTIVHYARIRDSLVQRRTAENSIPFLWFMILILLSIILYIIIIEVYNIIIIVSCSRRVSIRNVGILQLRGRIADMR